MKRSLLALGLVAGLATGGVAMSAHAWDAIGARELSYRSSDDTIAVGRWGRFHRIMVCAYQQPVFLSALSITFHNGREQHVNVATRLLAGGCTRAIDLNGRKRNIEEIRLVSRVSDTGDNDWRDRRDWRDDRGWWPGDKRRGQRHGHRARVVVYAE